MAKVLNKSAQDINYFGQFLYTLSLQKIKIAKTQEKLNEALKKYSLFVIFNETCIKEGLRRLEFKFQDSLLLSLLYLEKK